MTGTKPQSEAPVLLRADRDGVATLTLNRPKARNALSTALMTALHEELRRIQDDDDVRVVVIAGNGPGFCAGHDLKEIRANPGRQAYATLFAQCSDLMLAITRLPKPVICRVHGIATAAGCQLVATCDLAVATEEAMFATPGVNIGLFCSTPMVAVSRNVPRKQTMGNVVDPVSQSRPRVRANTAWSIGLWRSRSLITRSMIWLRPLSLSHR